GEILPDAEAAAPLRALEARGTQFAGDDPVPGSRRFAHGPPAAGQGRGRLHLQEGPGEGTRPGPLDRGHRRRRGVCRVPDRWRATDPRRVATGDGRPEEDDWQGVWRPPADPHPPGASVEAVRLRESVLLATRPEQRGRSRIPQD